jgi:hypothetical protein
VAADHEVRGHRLRGYVDARVRHFACRIATTSLAAEREQLELLIKLKPMPSDP